MGQGHSLWPPGLLQRPIGAYVPSFFKTTSISSTTHHKGKELLSAHAASLHLRTVPDSSCLRKAHRHKKGDILFQITIHRCISNAKMLFAGKKKKKKHTAKALFPCFLKGITGSLAWKAPTGVWFARGKEISIVVMEVLRIMVFRAFCKGQDSSWSSCNGLDKEKTWLLIDALTIRQERCPLEPAFPLGFAKLISGTNFPSSIWNDKKSVVSGISMK